MSGQPTRVLFILPQPFFEWRGSSIRARFDTRALQELGFEVDFLTLPVGETVETPGVRLIRVPNLFRVRSVKIGPSWIKALFDIVLFFHALCLGARRRYDVLHCVEDAGAIGVVLSRMLRTKLIFEKHSDASSYRAGMWKNLVLFLYAQVERFVVRHADAVIATGPGLVKQVIDMHTRTPVHHVFDIPSSLAVASRDKVESIRRQLERDPGDVLAFYVGSFAVYQGVDLMFQAIPEVIHRCPKMRFVVIGGSEKDIAERKAWLEREGVPDAVLFLGHVPPDELPSYLEAADIFLSPRLAGVNTPLKLLDYLKAGRAIVATDTEANRLILSSETAVLVTPDPKALADGLCGLYDSPRARSRMGDRGRRLITETYNFDAFRSRLDDCYRGVLHTEEAAS